MVYWPNRDNNINKSKLYARYLISEIYRAIEEQKMEVGGPSESSEFGDWNEGLDLRAILEVAVGAGRGISERDAKEAAEDGGGLLQKEIDTGRVQPVEENRAAVMIVNFTPHLGTIDYLNVGDLKLYVLRPQKGKKKIDKDVGNMTKKEKIDEGLVSPSTSSIKDPLQSYNQKLEEGEQRKELSVYHESEKMVLNQVHSYSVGLNGKTPKEGNLALMGLKEGDFIVVANRGVTDSLFTKEICAIMEGFINQPGDPDLDVMAEIITEKAFKKILEFEVNRPLVQIIKKGKVNPATVSVDECYCFIAQVKSTSPEKPEKEKSSSEKNFWGF